jgi:protein gp37
MNKTPIEWTDFTWNPIRARLKRGIPPQHAHHSGTFCTRISPGCTHCYASVINKRFGNGLEYTVPNLEKIEFFIDEKILEEPARRKKPARIFVGDMFDLFHEAIDPFWIGAVFGMILKAPQHTYQILTKRAARMREILTPYGAMDNVWLGVSVESQQYADERIPLLLQTPAAVRFLSVEPMLEAINLDGEDIGSAHALGCGDPSHHDRNDGDCRGVDWIICGGESGSGARPFNLAWAESLLEQCRAADVPFFMKQVGSFPVTREGVALRVRDRKGGNLDEWEPVLRVREFPSPKSKFKYEIMRCSQ